jgi:hypothetical protein
MPSSNGLLVRYVRGREEFSSFEGDVVALVKGICGPHAENWSTARPAFEHIQASQLWGDWMRSGLTKEQLVSRVNLLALADLPSA